MRGLAEDRRRQRSADTRERLLAAGAELFGARGFDAVGTRELADAAAVNQAAILYHFGGKDGLYLAVAEAIAERGRAVLRGHLPPPGAPAVPSTPAEARVALGALLRGMVEGLVTAAAERGLAAFVVREQATPGPAFDRLYDGYIRALHERVTALVAAATGRADDDPAAVLDAHAVVGMVLGFAVAREAARRRLGWAAIGPPEIARIGNAVAALADGALACPPRSGAAP